MSIKWRVYNTADIQLAKLQYGNYCINVFRFSNTEPWKCELLESDENGNSFPNSKVITIENVTTVAEAKAAVFSVLRSHYSNQVALVDAIEQEVKE